VLECISVVIGVIIKVVGVSKKAVFCSKNIRCGNIEFWQRQPFWFRALHNLVSALITQIFTLFVPEVSISISVTNYFKWLLYPDRTMICCNDEFPALLSY